MHMWYVQKFLKYSNIFEYSYIQPLVDWQDHRNRLGEFVQRGSTHGFIYGREKLWHCDLLGQDYDYNGLGL